ncbi:hypothetical protein U1Q18_049526, partial [Sarracenia purpurea var. burkii]
MNARPHAFQHPKVDDAAQAYARSFRPAQHFDEPGSLSQVQPVPMTVDPACSSGHLPTPASQHSLLLKAIEGVGKQ